MTRSSSIEPSVEPRDEGSGKSQIDLRIANEKTDWLDQVSDKASEWLSPILIKELRQAIKSYQFAWTFFLLLVAVVLWTLIGWTANQPIDDYSEVGTSLLAGYYWILGFPLGIVIPFAAYRSLAREFDDGTIQLISISTMRSWQIVIGKLVSSALQMLIYLAILAPCISFTYLLRGIGISQITDGLAFCIVGSCLLSSLGLFLAAVARSRFFSVGISILLVIGLVIMYCIWCGFSLNMAYYPIFSGSTDPARSIVMFGWVGFAISTMLLLLAATSSLISFESDNRSTLPKSMMLVQQTVFLAWCICMMSIEMNVEVFIGLVFVLSHYWMIMGFAMVGESPNLSERVQRTLPQSTGMRSLFSLFVPGPGRGLIYSVSNLWLSGALLLLVACFGDLFLPEADRSFRGFSSGRTPFSLSELNRAMTGASVAFFYVTLFISLMYLAMRFLAKKTQLKWGPIASVLLGLAAVALATTISLVLHYNLMPRLSHNDFSVYLIGNWYWATWEGSEPGGFLGARFTLFPMALMVCASMVAIAIAVVLASRELLTQPVSMPGRVRVDDQQIEQAMKPPVGETIDDIFNEPRPDDTS